MSGGRPLAARVSAAGSLIGVTATSAAMVMLVGCMTTPLRPAEADGTYCYRIGKSYRQKVTCTTAPVPSDAVEASAKQFGATPDAATLYVVRKRWADASNRVPVSIDGREPVLTIPVSLMRVRLRPGEHQVTVEWEGKRKVKSFAARAGEVVFIELEGSVWAWGATYGWAQEDEDDARERAVKSKLIADLDFRL